MLDTIKQISFYTDCFGDKARWSCPGEAVDADFAPAIIAIAKLLKGSERVTTVRELQLWVDHVSPHYGKPAMAAALLAFQQQVFDEGLSNISAEELEEFMVGASLDNHPEARGN